MNQKSELFIIAKTFYCTYNIIWNWACTWILPPCITKGGNKPICSSEETIVINNLGGSLEYLRIQVGIYRIGPIKLLSKIALIREVFQNTYYAYNLLYGIKLMHDTYIAFYSKCWCYFAIVCVIINYRLDICGRLNYYNGKKSYIYLVIIYVSLIETNFKLA